MGITPAVSYRQHVQPPWQMHANQRSEVIRGASAGPHASVAAADQVEAQGPGSTSGDPRHGLARDTQARPHPGVRNKGLNAGQVLGSLPCDMPNFSNGTGHDVPSQSGVPLATPAPTATAARSYRLSDQQITNPSFSSLNPYTELDLTGAQDNGRKNAEVFTHALHGSTLHPIQRDQQIVYGQNTQVQWRPCIEQATQSGSGHANATTGEQRVSSQHWATTNYCQPHETPIPHDSATCGFDTLYQGETGDHFFDDWDKMVAELYSEFGDGTTTIL
jgi:hypothetical protein